MTKKSLFLLNSFNSTELKNIIKNPNEQKIFPLTFSAVKKLQNLTSCGKIADFIIHSLKCKGCKYDLRERLNSSYKKNNIHKKKESQYEN